MKFFCIAAVVLLHIAGNLESLSGVSGLPTGDIPLPPPPENRTRTNLIQNEINQGVRRKSCTTTLKDSPNYLTRNGIRSERYRWRQFAVAVSSEYTDEEREVISAAMDRLHNEALTCIDFVLWPKRSRPIGDHVYIKNGDGCSSPVGRQGGRQEMNLAKDGCMTIDTIMHEMIHALGFDHEQSRPDRDDYIDIHWENIEPGMEDNFEKLSSRSWTTFGVPYNTKSIMHYDSYAFSINQEVTMTEKDGGLIGWNTELVDTDIQKLKKMYNCS